MDFVRVCLQGSHGSVVCVKCVGLCLLSLVPSRLDRTARRRVSIMANMGAVQSTKQVCLCKWRVDSGGCGLAACMQKTHKIHTGVASRDAWDGAWIREQTSSETGVEDTHIHPSGPCCWLHTWDYDFFSHCEWGYLLMAPFGSIDVTLLRDGGEKRERDREEQEEEQEEEKECGSA